MKIPTIVEIWTGIKKHVTISAETRLRMIMLRALEKEQKRLEKEVEMVQGSASTAYLEEELKEHLVKIDKLIAETRTYSNANFTKDR